MIHRDDKDPRTPEQKMADGAALQAYEDGTFLTADTEPAVNRAKVRSPRHSFDAYQKFTGSTAVYPGSGTGSYEAITYCALKGGGETGEFLEKLGKHMRKQGSITALNREALGDDLRLALAKELGDRLWYIAQGAAELGFTLSEIAGINVAKLSSRKERGVIVGEGDDR